MKIGAKFRIQLRASYLDSDTKAKLGNHLKFVMSMAPSFKHLATLFVSFNTKLTCVAKMTRLKQAWLVSLPWLWEIGAKGVLC